jgi:hypothetical protein
MRQGISSIETGHADTLKWIWTPADLGFVEWLARPDGMYWIQGTPGSGKSTLMKYLANSTELKEWLDSSIVQPDTTISSAKSLVLSFAFRFDSGELPGSVEGMLRSLLWQVAEKSFLEDSFLLERYRKILRSQHEVQWTHDLSRECLVQMLRTHGKPVCILVDGLDEHLGNDYELATFMDRLSRDISSNVRLCVASRPHADFVVQFRSSNGFEMQTHTADDIRTYVLDIFEEAKDLGIDDWRLYEHLTEDILHRARGSFIWVKLACNELQRNWRRSRSFNSLQQCLDKMPSKLTEFYDRIFDQADPDELQELCKILAILTAASAPLVFLNFCHIFDLSEAQPDRSDLLPLPLQKQFSGISKKVSLSSECTCRNVDGWRGPWSIYRGPVWSKTRNPLQRSIEHEDMESPSVDDSFIEHESSSEDTVEENTTEPPCPHAAAHPFHDDVQLDRWFEHAKRRINLAARGLITTQHGRIIVAHETISRYWNDQSPRLWPQPPGYGQQMILRAITAYGSALPTTDSVDTSQAHIPYPYDIFRLHEMEVHYPFLKYAVYGYSTHWQELHRMQDQSSLLGSLRLLTASSWKILQPWAWGVEEKIRGSEYKFIDMFDEFSYLDCGSSNTVAQIQFALAFSMPYVALQMLARSRLVHDLPGEMNQQTNGHCGDDDHWPPRGRWSGRISGTLFYLAALYDEPAIVESLNACGVAFGDELHLARNALHLALWHGNLSMLESLLTTGAAGSSASRDHDWSVSCAKHDGLILRSSKLTDDDCFSANFYEEWRYSTLQRAVFLENEDALAIILPFVDAIPAVTGTLDEAFMTAVCYQRTRAIEMLLEAGANPNCTLPYPISRACKPPYYYPSVLSTAVDDRRGDLCELLLRYGADPMLDLPECLEEDPTDGTGRSAVATDVLSDRTVNWVWCLENGGRPPTCRDVVHPSKRFIDPEQIPREHRLHSKLPLLPSYTDSTVSQLREQLFQFGPGEAAMTPLSIALMAYWDGRSEALESDSLLDIIATMSRHGADLRALTERHPMIKSIVTIPVWHTWLAHYSPKVSTMTSGGS